MPPIDTVPISIKSSTASKKADNDLRFINPSKVMRLSPFIDGNPFYRNQNMKLMRKIADCMLTESKLGYIDATRQKPKVLMGQIISPEKLLKQYND